jgi:hypothetical protein
VFIIYKRDLILDFSKGDMSLLLKIMEFLKIWAGLMKNGMGKGREN